MKNFLFPVLASFILTRILAVPVVEVIELIVSMDDPQPCFRGSSWIVCKLNPIKEQFAETSGLIGDQQDKQIHGEQLNTWVQSLGWQPIKKRMISWQPMKRSTSIQWTDSIE